MKTFKEFRKNLEEHPSYYSGLTQYESTSGQNYGGGQFNKVSFKISKNSPLNITYEFLKKGGNVKLVE